MRVLAVIVVIVLILAAVGWLQFSSLDGEPTVRFDTEKARQDTSEVIDQSKQAIDRAAEKIDASIDRDPIAPADQP